MSETRMIADESGSALLACLLCLVTDPKPCRRTGRRSNRWGAPPLTSIALVTRSLEFRLVDSVLRKG